MKLIIIVLILIGLLLMVGCGQEQKLKVQSKCRVQDNTNYSHWCEFDCEDNNLIKEAIRCKG